MPPVISVRHLSKQFGDTLAVDDLSFTVHEGDIYGFLGQNGAGKSTTIRMLLSLVKPSSGEIRIFGKDLNSHRSSILRQVGALIEKPDLYKYLSAYENLALFAKLSGLKADRRLFMHKLDMVGLAGRASGKVKTFSQGMKQRLGIAVALVHDPPLILLDEPVNGLDPQGIADIRNLIRSLSRDEGKTILISSHLLSEIELTANRMLIIHQGRKMVEGEVSALLDPTRSLVQLDTGNDVETRQKLQQTGWKDLVQTTGDGIQLKMDLKKVPELVSDLVRMKVQVISVKPSSTLEDYFLSLTTRPGHVEAFTD
ncbi:MAG: ABC transporter ATP-binding protein [Chitinophagaceae bacterium]|nr:ABC transporter ATP-binding protein [Chitinophagaceae bacterium]